MEIENRNEIEIINYFKENGYTEDSAKKFFNYYSVSNWKDSNGKEVKNWKQKAQSVWFKDENKIKVEEKLTVINRPMTENWKKNYLNLNNSNNELPK